MSVSISEREKEKERKGNQKLFEEVMPENFPNLKRKQISRSRNHRVPNRINSNRSTPRHVVIQMAKIKERILKASREKQLVTYKGAPIRLVDNFSAETLQARREWHYIFKVMKGKNL